MGAIRLFFWVLGLAFLGAVGGLGVFWMLNDTRVQHSNIVAFSFGNQGFKIPAAYFRGTIIPRSDAPERADLVLAFPDMAAAGQTSLQAGSPTGPAANTLVFLAITRTDGVLDPAERPQDVYGRFLEPDTWQSPGGLVLRRFAPDSPYHDEELFLSPPDGRSFFARCRRKDSIADACLWRYRLNGADVQVRFSSDLLPQWEALTSGLRQKLAQWTAQ